MFIAAQWFSWNTCETLQVFSQVIYSLFTKTKRTSDVRKEIISTITTKEAWKIAPLKCWKQFTRGISIPSHINNVYRLMALFWPVTKSSIFFSLRHLPISGSIRGHNGLIYFLYVHLSHLWYNCKHQTSWFIVPVISNKIQVTLVILLFFLLPTLFFFFFVKIIFTFPLNKTWRFLMFMAASGPINAFNSYSSTLGNQHLRAKFLHVTQKYECIIVSSCSD